MMLDLKNICIFSVLALLVATHITQSLKITAASLKPYTFIRNFPYTTMILNINTFLLILLWLKNKGCFELKRF